MSRLAAPTSADTLSLDTPVQFIKGVGPRRSESLGSAGIRTVADLLDYPPFRYEDRTRFRPIRSLEDGEWALVRAQICSVGGFEAGRRRISIVELLAKDDTGSVLLKFFNQPYLRHTYHTGAKIIIYGQVKRDEYANGSLCFSNPECELIEDEDNLSVHSGRVVPVYRKLGELRTRMLRQIIFGVVGSLPPDMSDPIPPYLRRELRLPPRHKSLAAIHFPDLRGTTPEARAKEMELLNSGLSPAHKRMIFEELFEFQVTLMLAREKRLKGTKDRRILLENTVREAVKKILPFHPTSAQKRVLKEIVDDLRAPTPMSRLLQGDVGSGKTIVAAQAATVVVENGFQVAIMAPTEILAEQHFFNFRRLFNPLGYCVDLIRGGLPARQKQEILARIQEGITKIAIGTHALIQRGVEFRNLALVIIDEQHRFGVIQRNILKQKGLQADVLVMTATPIPRSLALTLYGDLDCSVIDELPPGREPIETVCLRQSERRKVFDEIRRAVYEGHQVYVVYPLVEESEQSDLSAAVEMAESMKTKIFPEFRVGLLHGRMKGVEKDLTMTAFVGGEIDILVSTTVIEVGVDVSNATLMVIEHAERFGLSQLHQLRGRVGRGTARSRCILVGDVEKSPEAKKRIEIMCDTNDGFRIAEVDLELRGPGEIAGTRQSGIPAFKYANLIRDRRALEIARSEAERFVQVCRRREDAECRRTADLIRARWSQRQALALIG